MGQRARLAVITAALVATVAAGAWLRLHAIDSKSLWTDEGVSAAFTRLGWLDLVRTLWRREANMTLYYVLLRAWSHIGDSVAMLRGFSVLPSLAAIPLIYALGRRLANTATGLTAALLLAVNAYSIRYAQEARSYSLVMFLVVLAAYFLVRAVQDGRKQDWNWYFAASALAIYAHFFAVLVVLAHWVSLRLLDKAGGQELGAATSFRQAGKRIALWTLPIWIFIATTGAGPIKWIRRPGAHDLYFFLKHFSGNGGVRLLLLYVACTLVFCVAAVRSRRSGALEQWRSFLPLIWFVVPIAIALLFSLARPVFLARYMIICLPALVLMVAMGLTSFRQRWLALPVLALLCWLAVGGVRAYYVRDFDLSREDFRSASEYVVSQVQPQDAILFYNGAGRFPFGYYVDHSKTGIRPVTLFPGSDTPSWRNFSGKITPAVLDQVQNRGRVWLVLSENLEAGREDTNTGRIRDAAASTHRLAQVRQFDYVRVYLYEPQGMSR